MADDPRLATSEAVVMRNMEGYVQNSGIHNVSSPRLRPVMYPVTEAGVGFGNNPSVGWYAHHAGIMDNANFVYQPGGGGMTENPNFNYRVGYGRGIVENPGVVQQIGGGSGENSGFVNRGGGGGGASCDSRGNVSDQASDEGVDDQSSVKKVKFLCSFGGKIIPRPSDGVLRYIGGQTRIISVKSDISFQELLHKMIDVYGKPVVIRYQLPDGELDALVSVSCPEDLENMMDEYGKLAESTTNGSAKLRVFLFSASELDPSGLLQFGDLLDSGQRYMDAVNGIPDSLGDGIARKVSLGSETSTQNSDATLGASEVVDGSSYGQGDGGGLSSPYIISPRFGAVSTHDTPTSMMYATSNPVVYTSLMHAGPSETFSSLQPETEFKRPMPPMMHPQTSLGYDFHKPSGMDFQQATTYMQAYADPRQQFSSQVGYMNPQGVGITGPIYRYAATPTQLRDNTFGIPNQQFMPAVPMSAAPLNNHIGINSNVIQQVVQPPNTRDPYLGENASRARVVQFPVEQNYSAYQSQSPSYQPTSPFQAAGGSGLVSSTQHVVPSDGWAIHHPDDNTSVSGASYDHARQIDGTVERTYTKPQYPHLNSGIQYMPLEQQMHGQSALSALNPEYVTYETRPVMQRNVPNDAFLNTPVPLSGNTLSTHGRALQADEEAVTTRTDTFYLQPSELMNKDFIPSNKDEALEDNKQDFKATAEDVLNNKDSTSEHNQSNKDENIRHELKSVAEGVAAMVLQSSLPSDSSVGIDDSSSEIGHGRVLDRGVEASTDTIEDVKTKQPEKENSDLPLSEGIGHLQIIKNGDLEELRELGSGTFGTVYHGKWRGTDVAIKRINNRCFAGKPSERSRMIDDFWNEAVKLADLHHPNVVAFYGVVLDGPGDSVATVTEYMVNGSLRQALVRALNRRKRLLIAMDVAFGMEYLHGKNIVHFDLKSDNLLVNLKDPHRPICKVGDLGLSKVKCHTLISGGVRGTLPWMAPELLNGSSSLVSEKVDVFSFGIVMWELLTGEEPYADLHYGVIIGGIVSNTLRPEIPLSCDPEWRALMERCWAPEPLARPNFTEIANELRSMAANLPAKGQSPKE